MYNNPSSALSAMKATIAAVHRVRQILASEAKYLPNDSYEEMERYLSTIEYGLCQEMGEYDALQYTPPPHLFEDDDDIHGNGLWNNLVSWATSRG